MSRGIEKRWRELSAAPDRAAFQLLDADHPLSLYIGKAMSGEPMFLIVDAVQPPTVRGLKSVEIEMSRRPDGRWNLLLTLRNAELSGPFGQLCEDLASASRHLVPGQSGMELLGRRLSAWLRLLENGRGELLSASEIRGLMGELVLLEKFLASGVQPREAIAAWVGPLRADQDFQFTARAWEVKTVFPDADFVQIASESQLDASERALLLAVVTLVETFGDDGLSLNAQVLQTRALLGDRADLTELLDERLSKAGYVTHAGYDATSFRIGVIRLFRVEAGFPRLRAADLPAGVTDASYRVRLDACSPYAIELPPGWD
jgi:hypothetical protein